MTDLAGACAGLARWLPAAEALITAPDADGNSGRGQPSSRPPWNGAVAMALLDALEGIRQLEASWRLEVTGRAAARRPVSATGATLAAVARLSHARPPCPPREDDAKGRPKPCQCIWCRGTRDLARWEMAILQLAAIDKEERPVRVAAACPYCGFPMLRAYIRERKVACLRGAGACADSDGNPPRGQMGYSRLDGTPQIEWDDGLVT